MNFEPQFFVDDYINQLNLEQDALMQVLTPHWFPTLLPSPPLELKPANQEIPNIALFPDLTPVPAVRRLMPKIAPRPGTFSPEPLKRKRLPTDEVALKRQKNTDAARRSRLKKIIKMETMEKKVSELEADHARLTTRVAVLESEKNALESKDKSLEDRIRVLEAQLAEAHRALTTKNT